MDNEVASENRSSETVSTFRRIFPQVLACSVLNLMIWSYGLTLAFPTIVVAAVATNGNNLNKEETLHLSPNEATWLASILYATQPLGSILSSLYTDILGRKNTLFIVCVPFIASWILFFYAYTFLILLIGFSLLGFGVGLMESPLKSLYSEICEPSIRGVLMALFSISTTLGIFTIYLLGALNVWRRVAIFCSILPIAALVGLFFIPESPQYLLSCNRTEDALKALQWLRGWTSPRAVFHEYNYLKRHNEMSRACASCKKSCTKCEHPAPTLYDTIKDMPRKRNMKPFFIMTILNILMQFCAMFVMRPFIVQVIKAHGIPFDTDKATIGLGVVGIISNICQMLLIRRLGKRNIYLFSLLATFLCCLGLSMYGFIFFPSGYTSFDNNAEVLEEIKKEVGNWSYFALAMCLILHICYTVGLSSLPHIVVGELFSFQSRSFYCGIVSAEAQLLGFIANKIYYDLEVKLSLAGTFSFFGFIDVIGFIAMYLTLPETEQRSLEDIELHFSDDTRGLTDINIRINRNISTDERENNSA